MDRTKWPAIIGLVAGTSQLSLSIRSTFALDKPVHTSILLLASLAATLLVLSRVLPRAAKHSHRGEQGHNAVPLEDVHANDGLRAHRPYRAQDVSQPLRKLRLVFVLLVANICTRVAIVGLVLANVQCAQGTWATFIPLVFAILDYLSNRTRNGGDKNSDYDITLYGLWERRMLQAPYRYVVAIAVVCVACMTANSTTSSPASTHICAASLSYTWLVPFLQHVGTILDVASLSCLEYLLHQEESWTERSPALKFSTVGWASIISAITLTTSGIAYYFAAEPDARRAILTIPNEYFWSTLRLNALFCITATCTLICIYHLGTTTTALVILFTTTLTSTTAFAWAHPHPFPIRSAGLGFFAASIAMLAFTTYFQIEALSESTSHGTSRAVFTRLPTPFYLFMLIIFALRACLWAQHDSLLTYHPIDLLIWEAKTEHEAYVNQTSSSKSLDDAVRNYRTRYNKQPPPGFDIWYLYATERDSIVIDDFDSIDQDLLPFYALPPNEIRRLTWEMIANPWNDAAGLSIREGKVAISPHVVPTHRWMLDGLVDMIGQFAQWLPDMDLAFNLNDECRIAVPHRNIERMRDIGRQSGTLLATVTNTFSPGRAEQWTPIPDEPITSSPLTELSFQSTFYQFGSIGCSPMSPSRKQRHWSLSSACNSCASPHSHGITLANWTLAADICHQPDLANLHGLYLSPAAFKGTHVLHPVFSQSKSHGFNDILYPSAWNYIDKAVYRPDDNNPDLDWAEKNNTLFWRGATSEGVSPGGSQWLGMTRQRFVHLASTHKNSNAPQAILLPTEKHNNTHPHLTYTYLPISKLSSLISTDVKFVDGILRCGGKDCTDQDLEFSPFAEPSDFQHHWAYKYLLDLDGAGFSGRFLPFLASKSLPFKAGIFREWWDDRLTAWVHFVPLDLRGQGFWATLAYFAGVEGMVEGRNVEGERIARMGSEWAGKVLRKEDMEIYFFRLLLEWGRLTDDQRDGIGFSG